MQKPIDAILIGAGNRGAQVYARYGLRFPERLRFTAVAEPDPVRRAAFAQAHGIQSENCYESWERLLERGQLAKAALVCTQDNQHTQPTLAALKAGYHVLLEKPMATSEGECRQLVQSSRTGGAAAAYLSCAAVYPPLSKIKRSNPIRRPGTAHPRNAQREPSVVAHGAQLRARQLAQVRRNQPDDPGEMLP
jgi:hypothetical protein